MTATTSRVTTPAALWQKSAACQGIDEEEVFSTRAIVQSAVQGVCRGCPVRTACLVDILSYENGGRPWGVVGGLTEVQRRALHVEARLGCRPNLRQAEQLARPRYAEFMRAWRDWPPDMVADELRKLGVLVSAVTVRLALWWTGAAGSLVLPRAADDRRSPWMVIRDEHRTTVTMLRELGVASVDTAAYLGVAAHPVQKAVRAWRLADAAVEMEVAA
ncbi:WhiB family transcriptional regulator [Streptomyces sp. NPDC001288]